MPTDTHRSPSNAVGRDVLAGLTAAAVVLPTAMAHATMASLPVSVGLYTALLPMVVYALLGSSRVLSVSSTATLAILTGVQISSAAVDFPSTRIVSITATLTALVGLLLLMARLMRLGFIGNFISAPVLTGFKAGIGLVILLDQVPKLTGIPITEPGFFGRLVELVAHVNEVSWTTLSVGVASLLVLTGVTRRWPRCPAPIVALGGSIAVSWLFDLPALGVSTVGPIPVGLPSLTLPDPHLVRELFPGACGMALMSFTESIAAGRSAAKPGEPPVDANREMVALGAANLLGVFAGAMPAGGGTSQTVILRAAGARSQKASLVTACAAVATMVVLAPVLSHLPIATLAAVITMYAARMIQPADFVAIRQVRTMEFRWAVAAALGVLLFGTLKGITVAIILSLIGLSAQSANPTVHVIGRKRGTDLLRPLSPEHPDDETFEGLLILRPEGRLFFVNAPNVGVQIEALRTRYKPRVVALDLSRVVDIEYSALRALMEGEKRATQGGTVVWLVALNPAVLEVVRRAGFDRQLGPDRLILTLQQAIDRYLLSATAGANETKGR